MVETTLRQLEASTLFSDKNTQGSVRYQIEYYRLRAPWRRLAFRVIGAIIIVVNISLPFLTTIGYSYHTYVTLGATLSSALTALLAFLNLQKAWAGYILAQLKLERAWSRWEAEKALALAASDPAAALRKAATALREETWSIVQAETTEFFEAIRLPEAPSPEPKTVMTAKPS